MPIEGLSDNKGAQGSNLILLMSADHKPLTLLMGILLMLLFNGPLSYFRHALKVYISLLVPTKTYSQPDGRDTDKQITSPSSIFVIFNI